MSTSTRLLAAALVAALVMLLPRPAAAQPVPYLGPIDVAFAIDDTGSMVDALASLNTSLPGILDRIERASDPGAGGPDYRLSLVTFKDDVTIRLNFSANNRDAFTQLAAALTAAAGGRLPEASDEALNTIINALPQRLHQNIDFAPAFRPEALRVIVLLTDTLPGGFDDLATPEDVANAHARAAEAAAAGIKIAAIFTPQTDATEQTAQDVMNFYATTTGGVYSKVAPVDAGNAILQYFVGAPSLNRPPIAVCAPVIDTVSCPADANVDGGSWDPDGTIASTVQTPPGPYNQPTTDVVLTVTDNLGAVATCQTTVTLTLCGPQPPTIQAPTLVSEEATGPSGAVAKFDVTAADDQGNVVPVSCLPDSGSVFPLGQTTVTCVATDARGLSNSETFTVEIVDTTPPTLHLPGNATVEATAPTGAIYTYSASAEDLVDGAIAVNCTHESGAMFSVGTTAVSCTAADAHGNSAAGGFTVTVVLVDHVAPVVSVPGTMTAEAAGPAGAPVTFAASATDNLDASVSVTCAPASGSMFPLGTSPVTCHATDAHGNIGTASFTVSVVDTTAPVLSVPGNQSVDATTTAGAPYTFTATATDIVDGNVPVTCQPASGFLFPIGATPVNCTATDAHGNIGSGHFTVSVTLVDTTAPVVTVPTAITVEAVGPAGAPAPFTVSATDNLDPSPTITCEPASGSMFPLGTSPVTCHATDAHGNTGTASFTVSVVDTTAPAVSVPGNQSVDATTTAGATYTFAATATDLVDGTVAVSCQPPSGFLFPIGATPVNCTATDAHGNTGSGHFTVSVTLVDTTAPVVTVPTAITVEAVGPAGAAAAFTVSATDNLDPSPTVICTPPSGAMFALGTHVVTCHATDAHGNVTTASFTVTVTDTTAPAVSVPANQTLPAGGPAGAAFTFTATAADVVDGAIAPVCSPPSGFVFSIGSTLVTCTATDSHGNAAQASFTVTVSSGIVVPPRVWCERGRNPGGHEPQGEDGFVQVEATAADDAAPFTLALGRFALANHETIKITRTGGRSEIRLVNSANGIRHFQVPDDFEIVLMDRAGRRVTTACRDDDRHDRDRDRDR